MKTWMLSIAAALGASAACADFVLAERGKPVGCAIVAAGDAPSLRYAATELRDFTKRMTGVELAINPAQAPARRVVLSIAGEDDAFSLKVEGNALTVVGGVRGVLYGVYELLETYGGCGWYAPWCDEVPELARFAVPDGLDFADRPAIQMREPLWRHTRVPDFAARLRMSGNSFSLGPRHGGVSHRFSRRLQNCHTFARLVPTEKYFDAHPEYFSEVKGVRVRTEPQLCLSNPDVLRIVIDEVRKTIAAEPEAKYFGVSQNDWNNFCTCPKCAAIDEEEGSHAGTIVRFVNAVAEAIEKEHPDKIIETLAYNWGRKAPKKTKVRHNVMICLCTTECDYSRPISEPGWKGNAACLEAFREWGAICSNLYVWNYNLNTYHNVSPYPNFRSMQGNFRLFRDSHASSVYEEGDHLGWHSEFAELKAYLTAKWTWNPDIPAEKLLTKFFNGYYGAAAPYVRRYFDELNALPVDPTVEPLDYQRTDMSHFVPDAFLRRADGLWQQALEAVKGDAVRAYNVRMGRLSVDYECLVRDLRVIRMDSKGLSPKRIALARRVQAALDEAAAAKRPVCLSHGEARAADFAARIRAMAEGKAVGDGRKAFVEETVLDMSRYGSYMKFADDPAASGGQALKLFDNYHNWYVTFHPDKVAFDPGVKYRARIRARFDRRPGATDDLPVLDCGIYNPTTKTFTPKRVWTVKDFPADGSYALMGDLDWIPAAGDVMWIMPGDFDRAKDDARNPALTGLYIDGIELTRAEPAADAAVLTAETAEIVVAPGGTKTTDFTAQELKGLLGQILGGEIPVRKAATPGCVSLVLTNDVSMARDSFRIVSDPAAARVTIAGFDGPTDLGAVVREGRYQSMRTAVGTLYGAYELLERWAGARFYFPGEIGTILPKAAKVFVPKGDVVRAPAFVNRNIYFNGDGAWLDGNPCGPEGRCSEKALHWLRLRLETFNIPCCHGQIGFDYRNRFAKTHPEYFALLPDRAQGGKLRRDNDPERRLEYHPDQLCHSSGIWDVFADDIRAQRRGDKPATRGLARWGGNFGGRYVDIMPMDGMPKCRCAACEGWYAKAKDPKTQYATDLVWGNTAKLVNALNAEGIDATYTMMAYSCYRAIPDVSLPSNILVMVAEGGPWHKHIPGKVAEEKAEIRAWAEKLNAKVRVWTYPGKYARYQVPNVPQMTPRAYADYFGDLAPILAGGFIETESDRFLYNYLNYYVFAWLAWHPDGDVKAMLDEHDRLMFGAAAPQLKRFYEELEDKWLKEVCVVAEQAGVPTDLSRRVPDILMLATKTYSPEVLAAWDRLFDMAERAVADDPLSLKRVKFVRAEFLDRMKAHFSGYLASLDVEKARAARASLDPAKNLLDESKARPAKTGKLTRDTTCFVTAPDSIRVDSSFMGWPGAYFDIGKTLPKLKPNATYRISYYLKYENVEPLTADSGVAVHVNYKFRYGWMNPNIPFVGSHDWMFQSFDIKTGRNASVATFLAFGLIDAKGTVWFDDIRVEEVTE